jgi:hypothetical protein
MGDNIMEIELGKKPLTMNELRKELEDKGYKVGKISKSNGYAKIEIDKALTLTDKQELEVKI